MSKFKRICVLGGTGFVGQHVVEKLASQGHSIRILSRNRERHRDLLVLPTVEIKTADIHNLAVLNKQFAGMDAVVNLVGTLNESSKKQYQFQTVHIDLTHKIIDACHSNSVRRLLHMSAINADAARGVSKYLRSKGQAENLVHSTSGIYVTSFKPSVIFGNGDSFLNRFAHLLKMTPRILPFPLACPNARFAPVYVEDIASAFAIALDNKLTYGKRYNLCGPKIYTLKQLVEYVEEIIGVKRTIISLGNDTSKLFAALMEMMPGKPFTLDNYRSMKTDSVCENSFPEVFNIKPVALETIAPTYLANRQPRTRYYDFRIHAGRDS